MPAIPAIAVMVAGAGGTAAVGGAVTFGLASGMAASVIGGAVIGAVAGALTAVVMGEDVLQGAIQGGLVGAIGGGLMAYGAAGAGGAPSTATGMDVAALSTAEADLLAGGAVEAGTGNVAAQMVTGTLPAEQAVAITGQNVIAEGGTLFGMSTPEIMAVTGSLVEGVGGMLGEKLAGDEAEERATTAYERGRAKLQEGVELDTPTIGLDKEAWRESKKEPGAELQQTVAAGEEKGLLPGPPSPTVAPVAPPVPEKFESTVQRDLLNKPA